MADTKKGLNNIEDPKAAKAKLKADKKEFQKKLKEQRKEQKAMELEFEERNEEINGDNAGGFATIVITLLIILIWLAIMALLIKLDVGGFGSGILAPLIKDVPYLNLILPDGSVSRDVGTTDASSAEACVTGMDSLDEANAYIRRLEQALQSEMEQNSSYAMTIDRLNAEINRLEPFERQQREFYEERASFMASIVYGDYAPDASLYASYYEWLYPEEAASIYQRVITDQSDNAAITAFANTYSGMKAKQAAAIFDEMIKENEIELVARMLAQMTIENRGAILAAMEKPNAAKLTLLLEPLALEEEETRVSGKKVK